MTNNLENRPEADLLLLPLSPPNLTSWLRPQKHTQSRPTKEEKMGIISLGVEGTGGGWWHVIKEGISHFGLLAQEDEEEEEETPQFSSTLLFLALGDRIWKQFNVGPLGFASDFGEGDIVKLDFIVVHGRGRDEGTKKQAAFSISLFLLLLLLSCLFNGIKVGIFASRWFRDRTF